MQVLNENLQFETASRIWRISEIDEAENVDMSIARNKQRLESLAIAKTKVLV